MRRAAASRDSSTVAESQGNSQCSRARGSAARTHRAARCSPRGVKSTTSMENGERRLGDRAGEVVGRARSRISARISIEGILMSRARHATVTGLGAVSVLRRGRRVNRKVLSRSRPCLALETDSVVQEGWNGDGESPADRAATKKGTCRGALGGIGTAPRDSICANRRRLLQHVR